MKNTDWKERGDIHFEMSAIMEKMNLLNTIISAKNYGNRTAQRVPDWTVRTSFQLMDAWIDLSMEWDPS